MYSNRGLARLVAEDRTGARELFERAQHAAGDAEDVELVNVAQNLAQLEVDPVAALRLLRSVYDRYATALGPTHPVTLTASQQVAALTPDRAVAGAQLEAAYRSLERWKGQLLADVAWKAAWIADESDDRVTAAAWMARIPRSDSPISTIAAAYTALELSPPDAANRLADLEQFAATLDQSFVWNRSYAAAALVLVARAKPQVWERVLTLLETKPLSIYSRQLARARRMVAEQWATTRPEDARRLAEQALPWYRRSPGDAGIVARLELIASGTAR
jgi:hypothetical protein